jgi:RNA polymerase sigma factor (sigma-70 family)
MTHSMLTLVVRRLAAAARPSDSGRSDADLLRAVAAAREEAAFDELLRRYGRLVWAVCRRLLRQEQDAEDAFQAAFIVLATKASTVRCRGTLANWMYGVADRTARVTRRRAAKSVGESRRVSITVDDPSEVAGSRELCDAILDEVGCLPKCYRAPLVLCGLDGRTKPEAARMLGWKEGTVSGRLARALTLLHRRLARRGLVGVSPALAALPAVAPALRATTLQIALSAAWSSASSVPAALIAREVLSATTRIRPHVGALCVLIIGAAVGGYAAIRPATDEPKNVSLAAPPAAGDAGPATLQEVARIQGFLGFAFCTYSPDSRLLATVDGERQLHFWDLTALKERTSYDTSLRYESVDTNRARFSPDGKTFLLYGNLAVPKGAERKPEVTLIDVASGKERTHFPGLDPVIDPAGKVLAVRRGETVVLLALDTGQVVHTLAAGPPSKSGVSHSFSPDGALLFTAGIGGHSRLWEVATGRERARIEGFNPAFAKTAPVLATIVPGGGGKPWAERGDEPAAVTPESPATGAIVKTWNTTTGKEMAAVRGIEAPGCHIGISPDGRLLLTSPWHLVLQANGELEPPQPPPPGGGKVGHLEVRLWDTATGLEKVRLPGNIRYPHDAFFLADGRTVVYPRIVGPGDAMEMVFWDVAAQKIRMTVQHAGGVEIPRFSNDGNMMVAMVHDNQGGGGPLVLRFWDTRTGKEWISDVEGEGFQVIASMYTNFSPDGTMMTVPVPRGSFRVGAPVPPNELRLLRLSDKLILHRVNLGKPAQPPDEKPSSPGAKGIQGIHREFSDAQKERDGRLRAARSDEERRTARADYVRELGKLADRALEIVRQDPYDPAALDALEFAFCNDSSASDVRPVERPASAAALARQHYLINAKMARIVPWLARRWWSPECHELLAEVFEKHPDRTVRGRAGWNLAYNLAWHAEAARCTRERLNSPDESDSIKQLAAVDAAANERWAEEVFEKLQHDYTEVKRFDGQPETIGDGAERALFALRNLSVGMTPPEIVGEDLFGRPLKLSDYRGKVVVLIFSGEWCGSCRVVKPQLQALVKKLADKPFAVVEVNSDENREDVRVRRAAEGNLWKCWFDGSTKGPISRLWNAGPWPTIFVLDADGVIRHKRLQGPDLEKAVNRLLNK